jgi:hypothetical protein
VCWELKVGRAELVEQLGFVGVLDTEFHRESKKREAGFEKEKADNLLETAAKT